MKPRFFFLLLLGGLLVVPQFSAHALEEPAMTVSDLRLQERGATFAKFQLTVEGYDDATNSVAIYYSKKGESGVKMSYALPYLFQDLGGNYTQEGKNYVHLWNLVPETTYEYYLVTRQGEETTRGKVKAFTTRSDGFMSIDGATPKKVNVGDSLTIVGKGFGTRKGKVEIGHCYICNDEVQNWSDTRIVVKVGSHATNGPVTVSAYPFSGSSTARGSAYHHSASGPDIAVTNGQNNIYVLGGARSQCGEGLVTRVYGAIENFNNIYFEEYGRGAKCDELKFHLQRNTPHDRLRVWLNEQKEAKWWDDLLEQYDGQMIYNNNPKAVYLVIDGGMRRVPSFQVALAHGLIIDDATLMKDLHDRLHEGQVRYADYNSLAYTDGAYTEEIEQVLQGEEADTGNRELDDYITEHSKLLTKVSPSRSDDKDYQGICTFVVCGKIY